MDHDWKPLIVPLGPRLQQQANRLRQARRARVDWLEASERLRARVEDLLASTVAARHERVEVDVRPDSGEPRRADVEETADWASRDREPLPAVVRERLRSQVGESADAMRIHRDEGAHRIAETHRADAVASGADVYFRHGRYRPHDEEGFALIAHEATHVSQSLRPNAGWRRAMHTEVAGEEAAAIAVERSIRRPAAGPPRALERPTVATTSPAPAPRPRTASVDRSMDMAAPAPPLDIERLRQSLARDLMRQIRAELERGG